MKQSSTSILIFLAIGVFAIILFCSSSSSPNSTTITTRTDLDEDNTYDDTNNKKLESSSRTSYSSSLAKHPKFYSTTSSSSALLTSSSTVEFDHYDEEQMQSSQHAAICKLKSNTYKDLGHFPFWGRIMNSSFPCPAAGMNNQLTLFLAFWHCYEMKMMKKAKTENMNDNNQLLGGFKWKDVSCSPTGGKDGNRKFVVGSSDYSYAWFRWSEVYYVKLRPRYWPAETTKLSSSSLTKTAKTTTLCLHDSYSWKEHPELAKCNSNIGHLYGSKTWWELRGRLEPRRRFQRFAECFVEAASEIVASSSSTLSSHNNIIENGDKEVSDHHTISPVMNPLKRSFLKCVSRTGSSSRHENKTTSSSSIFQNGVLGLHIRRGDYAHFCAGLKGSSGIRKFRVPPFKWLSKNTEQLSTKFPDTCAPSDSKIIDHIESIITKSGGTIKTVFIASNSETLVEKIRTALLSPLSSMSNNNKQNGRRKLSSVKNVFALADIIGRVDTKIDVEKIHQIWPDELYSDKWRNEKFWRAQRYSATDKVMLDISILSLCEVVVLNRYSTFSQSVIDERVLRSATNYYSQNHQSTSEQDDDTTATTTTMKMKDDFTELPGISNGVKWW